MSDRYRPILDGIIVRMDPPATKYGSIHIPDDARAETGTIRGRREAKIGTVLAVGPGRWLHAHVEGKRNGHKWERGARDLGSPRHFVETTVRVGDRVLFDPVAQLHELPDGTWRGCEFQVCGIIEEG
jgi:co-chaperonin GroES (HSP10)